MCDDHGRFTKQVTEALAFLQQQISEPPGIAIVLGTGLGNLAHQLNNSQTFSYQEIPHFPKATVASHSGMLHIGLLQGKKVALLQGRMHYYEGYSTRRLTLPMRVLSLFGATTCIVSNAAGGLNPDFSPGTLMLIKDHMNLIPDNPLRGPNVDGWGPRFPDMSEVYDREYLDMLKDCAQRLGIEKAASGMYLAIPGPSMETPAETRMFRNMGGDAIGMSTVPEVIVAKHGGMRVAGISVIANVNDPDNMQPILLEDVLEQAEAAADDFQRLILEFLKEI